MTLRTTRRGRAALVIAAALVLGAGGTAVTALDQTARPTAGPRPVVPSPSPTPVVRDALLPKLISGQLQVSKMRSAAIPLA